MLQAGRSGIRDSMRSLIFLSLPNPSSLTRPWRFFSLYQKEKELLLGSRAPPAGKAGKLTAICQL
jgi:hypothetical protein